MTDAARRNDIRRAWLDEDTADLSAARAAKHRLVEQVRRLVDAAFQLDCGDAGYGADDGIAAVFERRAAGRGSGVAGGEAERAAGAERVTRADGGDAAGPVNASDMAGAVATDDVAADGGAEGTASRGNADDAVDAANASTRADDSPASAVKVAGAADAAVEGDRLAAHDAVADGGDAGATASRSNANDGAATAAATADAAVATDRLAADGAVADGGNAGATASRDNTHGRAVTADATATIDMTIATPDAARTAHFLALAAEAEALADRVSALPRIPRADVGGVDSSRARRHDALLVERSSINGRGNPLAPPVRMWADGDLIRAEAYFTAPYEGPPGRVHGAWVAACFDEVLGCAQGASGAFGFTGTLTITLRRATPLYTKITYEAGFSHREGRKIHAWGRCYADGQLTAEATGVFVVPAFGGVGHGTK